MNVTIYLFYPATFIGCCIAFLTKSKFCHAAIEINGVLYDSSERRGNFGKSSIDLESREYRSFYLRADLATWLDHHMGREYDWKGIIGWFFGKHNKRKFYCFEAVYSALLQVDLVPSPIPTSLNGDMLEKALTRNIRDGH